MPGDAPYFIGCEAPCQPLLILGSHYPKKGAKVAYNNQRGTAPDGGGEFGHLSYRLDFPSRQSLFSLLRRKRSHLLISSKENAS
jgi:hypothetical protein